MNIKYFINKWNCFLCLILICFVIKSQTKCFTWSRDTSGNYKNISHLVWLDTWDANAKDVAKIKPMVDSLPNGKKAIFLWDFRWTLEYHPKDILKDSLGNIQYYNHSTQGLIPFRDIWRSFAIDSINRILDTFFLKYKQAGGVLDYIICDTELGISNWDIDNLSRTYYEGNNQLYFKAINKDPRFASIAQTLSGCSFIPNVMDYWTHPNCYLQYNTYALDSVAKQFDSALYKPIKKHFPNVKFSDYGFHKWTNQHKVIGINGVHDQIYGDGSFVGTHQSKEIYGYQWQNTLPGSGPNPLLLWVKSPFNSFIYTVNSMRGMWLSDSLMPIMPWVAYRSYFSDGPLTNTTIPQAYIANSDYWQESILHAALTMNNEGNFNFWNHRGGQTALQYATSNSYFDRCLNQFDSLLNNETRVPRIDSLTDYYGNYVLTKTETPTRYIYRFTPRLDQNNTFQSVLQSQNPASFKVDNTVVTIPNSQVVFFNDTISKAGYWVISNKAVNGILNHTKVDDFQINIYPNPCSNYLNINSELNIEAYCIYNCLGQKLIEDKQILKNNFNINTSKLNSGIYSIELKLSSSKILSKKIIICKE